MELLTAFCEVGAYIINSRASAAACTLQFGIRGSSSSSTIVHVGLQSLSGTMSENATAATTGRGKAKAAKTKKPKTPSTHPTYIDMAIAAINALKERNGSSRQAILKYITSHYNIGKDANVVNTHLKAALKKGVNSAAIKHAKGQGASGSFRISEKPGSPTKKAAKKTVKAKSPKVEKAKAEIVKTAKKSPKRKKKEAAVAAKVKVDKKAKSPKKVAEKKQAVKAKKPKTPKKAAPKKKKKTAAKAKKVNSPRKAKK